MLKVFNLPDLGEGLTESELLSWKIAVGDTVAVNDVLAEVETAKAVVELSSPFDGTIAELHGEPGAVIQVGAPIISFDLPGAGPDKTDNAPASDAGSSSLPDGRVPTLVGYGAAVEGAGRPARRARAGRPAAPDPVTAAQPSGSPSSVPVPAGATATLTAERPRSTPPVRKLARDLGVNIALLAGSGAGGVVTREDVAAAADGARPASASPSGTDTLTEAAAGGVRTLGGRPRTEEEPIRSVRKATAAAMTSSAFTAPHVTEFLTVDVTESVELLQEVRQRRDFRELKLTPLTLVARAACLALERTPELNARWDGDGGRIIRQNYVNLGIAAATPRGLMVPNLKDAQDLDLRSLAIRLAELTEVAREGKLTPEQLSGGTFTLTNVGVFGVDAGTPIINPGEAGILAIGQVRRMPWEYRDEIALRQVMTLSLSFDHRLVDGEQGSRFLADVGAVLARPGMALALF
ncbi:dihydrolipoamide acetyltransferase component of pyruvate dehydrogenase complex [Citricoccus zhacaiensis]|uniref:Dihydrolipoamide acetyltransferase component of pyruvate dehydrogenase complex n=1 Tax=Citricoccus zhacaiensis TaxID=489142 RepID=A0ABQ2LMV1_9MICC|nr:dihydrolipoamide acetyltransferase family protein [Citricoccus zhacaiensis]GGO40663.1 dihydrolipoamide acetyltransferase component of pyruvate dehydrogenase complex [Citricoccus zhacaiensis]